MDKFFSIEKESKYELVVKKSKFIANAYYVENEKDAEEKIKAIKRKYYDARHNCYAYKIMSTEKAEYKKCSDDGEPSGTAGMPILNVIEKRKLSNILIIVTRYFGGILLGTGGLTRSYSDADCGAIENAEIISVENGKTINIQIPYSENKNFLLFCKNNDIKIINEKYEENIVFEVEINEEQYEKIKEKINNDNVDWKEEKATSNEIGRIFVKKPI